MEYMIIGGIAYAAVALLAARGAGFLRSCDAEMHRMMNAGRGGHGRSRHDTNTFAIKEALS